MATRNQTPAEVKALLDAAQGWTFLDVRSVEEFDAGHVPGACNVPLMNRDPAGMTPNSEFASVVQKAFARDAKLVVGCASGGRSSRACDAMSAAGYSDLVNMQGGFLGARDESGRAVPGWATAGFPVEKQAPAERTYAHLRGARG